MVALSPAAVDCLRLAAPYLRPPRPPRPRLAFARTMRLPDGPHQGQLWDPDTEPAQRLLLDAMDSGRWRIFVHVAPSQRGKTLSTILCPTLHAITEEGQAVGYVMPNLDKLNQNWVGKIRPAIEGSGFGGWLPQEGPGSKRGRAAALEMRDPATGRKAVLYFMAAGKGSSETSLSSVSPSRMAIDEGDDFENVGQIELALKRLESWGKAGMAFVASTVNNRGERLDHPILDLCGRADATQCRVAHRCPHCGLHQVIAFEQFDVESASLACAAGCGARWSEDDRHAALTAAVLLSPGQTVQDGVVIGDAPSGDVFSLLTTGFDYHMADLRIIAANWKAAKAKEEAGDFSLMETFHHKVLCRPYERPADAEAVTDRQLAMRSAHSTYERGTVPAECDRLVVDIDVQLNRAYWLAMAAGPGDKRYLIDWGEEFWTEKGEEPTDAQRYAVFDAIHAKARDGWPKPDGTPLRAAMLGIDIGYRTDSVGKWAASRAGVVPIRGDKANHASAVDIAGHRAGYYSPKSGSTLEREGPGGLFELRRQEHAGPGMPPVWWFVRTSTVRDNAAARWRRPIGEESALHLPHGLAAEDPLIRHLVSWRFERDRDTGLATWVQHGRRDDWENLTMYGLAMLAVPLAKPVKRSVGRIITRGAA